MSTERDGSDGSPGDGDGRAADDGAGYVHRPNAGSDGAAGPDENDLGRRGWVLVGAVVLAVLVIPGVIYLYPTYLADRVPFLVAMLALPFIPAVLLGAVAVWSLAGRDAPD